MSTDFSQHSAARWGCLPARMRLLFVSGPNRRGGWLASALAADSISQVTVEDAFGTSAGLARLRDTAFDAVLISHEPDQLDAVDFLEAIRATEGEVYPTVVLGNLPVHEMNILCYEAGADGYVCLAQASVRELLWYVARGMERRQLLAENLRLLNQQQHRLQTEHDEANHLLAQQRGLIQGLEQIRRGDEKSASKHYSAVTLTPNLAPFAKCYQDLLRAYVVMGSGSLNGELRTLANTLAASGVTAQQTLRIHLQVLENAVLSLGNRSARHVMNRADLLILELMMHLCDGYSQPVADRMMPEPATRAA